MPTPELIETEVAEFNEWKPQLITSSDLSRSKDLPAAITPEGSIVSRWKFSDEERKAIAEGADIYVFLRTYGKPMQPISITVPNT